MKPSALHRKEAARARQRSGDGQLDPRVYVNLPDLLRLQHRARGFSFKPSQPVHSLLMGRRASRIRGRGLNFEELRHYQAGDDIRTIDWKVTARTRQAHTRVYTEERDRSVILVVDQRLGMFYGTRENMKSVTAAQAAALGAWRVLDAGDRVGAMLFNDERVEEIRPDRQRKGVTRMLDTLVGMNHELSADSPVPERPEALDEALRATARLAKHDCLVIVLSDFAGFGVETRELLRGMHRNNDVLLGLVHDPSSSKLPWSRELVVSDGLLQVEVTFGKRKTRERIASKVRGRIAEVLDLQRSERLPVLPLSTAEDVVQQIQRLLGWAPARSTSGR